MGFRGPQALGDNLESDGDRLSTPKYV